jgi:hypothetical protein
MKYLYVICLTLLMCIPILARKQTKEEIQQAKAVHFRASTALGQDQTHPIESRLQASADSQAVGFKVPEGYMRSDFPRIAQRRYKGMLMLDQDSPSGMFIILLGEGQAVDEPEADVESIIKSLLVHSSLPEPGWSTSSLPAHEGVSDESGKLVTGFSYVQEIQIAVYRRSVGSVPFAYGYFAVRDRTGGMKEETNGKFLDVTGRGVKVFDKFLRSIKEVK